MSSMTYGTYTTSGQINLIERTLLRKPISWIVCSIEHVGLERQRALAGGCSLVAKGRDGHLAYMKLKIKGACGYSCEE